jgi:hypothetical protein
VLEVSYVGNVGRNIWRRRTAYNEVIPDTSIRTQIAEIIYNGGDASGLINANRRLTGVGPIIMDQANGESTYSGLQVWLNRRFANRLAYQVSYTWGHAISNVPLFAYTTATTDVFNYDIDKGDADLDRRHTFVANFVYELPGFDDWGKIGSAILGNWQINGIVSILGGVPADVQSGVNSAGLSGTNRQRPDLVPGVPLYLDNDNDPTTRINPAAFALPAPGRFGTLGRGTVRGPGLENVDFSLTKNWPFGERYNVQFRMEAFNLFNHPNFIGWGADGVNLPLNFQSNRTTTNFGQVQNGSFGVLTNTQAPREFQFGL